MPRWGTAAVSAQGPLRTGVASGAADCRGLADVRTASCTGEHRGREHLMRTSSAFGAILLLGAELKTGIDKALLLPGEAREQGGRKRLGPAAERAAREAS